MCSSITTLRLSDTQSIYNVGMILSPMDCLQRSLTQHAPHFDPVLLVDTDTPSIVDILNNLTENQMEGHGVLQSLPWVENLSITNHDNITTNTKNFNCLIHLLLRSNSNKLLFCWSEYILRAILNQFIDGLLIISHSSVVNRN